MALAGAMIAAACGHIAQRCIPAIEEPAEPMALIPWAAATWQVMPRVASSQASRHAEAKQALPMRKSARIAGRMAFNRMPLFYLA
jgi:hypothetical protein